MAHIIEAPNDISIIHAGYFSVFLAGSIENGKATDWQDKLSYTLSVFKNLVVLNPRRKHWNPDLGGDQLKNQILWEQNAIKSANMVVFYFDPQTKSPISLLELGQMLGTKQHHQLSVFCPPTFFRFTNVEVTCRGYGVRVHEDYNTFLADILNKISLHSS